MIGFGRYAAENAKKQGQRVGTFDFLGFTHFCDRTRKGKFKVGRVTDRKRFRVKIKEMNQWLKMIRNALPAKQWWSILCAKLRGHLQYYGVSGNYCGINRFYLVTLRLVYKWLNRRSQKKSYNWKSFLDYITRFPLPRPRIFHILYSY